MFLNGSVQAKRTLAAWIATVFLALAVTRLVQAQIPTSAAETKRLATLRATADKLSPLAEKKSPSAPGDWLADHPEPGQTFEQYRATNPNRPFATRRRIYIQPIGSFTPTEQRAIERAKELLGLFYGLDVKDRPEVSIDAIPERARRTNPATGQQQILTTFVLNELLPARRPNDAVAVLALTRVDLWPGEGWNYVFGQGAFRERVGVYSLARYGDAERELASDEDHATQNTLYPVYLRRTLKVAVHEMGHMLGMAHCTANECGMNGSNHLDELDRNRLVFCPECEQKVWWSCGLDPKRRYQSLVKFAEDNRLADEQAAWSANLKRVSNR